MKVVFLSLLVGLSLGASLDRSKRQVFGNGLGYLPPPPTPTCQASTVYRTQTQYSTLVVPSTVVNRDVQYVTQTSVSVQQVYTTIYSEIFRTQQIPSVVYNTQIVTSTRDNVRTQVVTLPPQVNYVTSTRQDVRTDVQYQTQYVTRTQQVPTTVTRNVVSTQVVPQQVVSTVYRTQTVTRTQQLPGQTRTIPSTQYSTVYSTQVIPGQDVVRTSEVVRTNVVTQTVNQPGQTRVITSTQVVPVTTTIYSEVVRTNTQTQYVTRTQVQQQVSTVVRTQQVPQYNTRIQYVTQPVHSTLVSTQVVPTTIYSEQVVPSIVNLPAQTQYITNTRTEVRTQYLPGQTRTQYVTRTIYNTNYATSTIYKDQYNTIRATSTYQPNCNTGYNYNKPSRPFNYGR